MSKEIHSSCSTLHSLHLVNPMLWLALQLVANHFNAGSMTTVRTLFKPMLKAHAHSAHVHVTFDASNIPALSSSCADENDFFSSVSAASSDAASASGQKMSKKPRKKARARTHADLCTTPLPAPSDEIHQTCQSGTKRASERGMRN